MAETAEECKTSSENEVKLSIVSFRSYLLLPISVYGAGLSVEGSPVVVPWQQTFVCSANFHEKFITAKTRIAARQATCTICAKFVVLFKPDESRGMVIAILL